MFLSVRPTVRAAAVIGCALAGAIAIPAATAAAAPTVSFAPAMHYPTGDSGSPSYHENGTATGDFNSDGRPDVVVAGFYSNPGVRVMYNLAAGVFATPATRVSNISSVVMVVAGDYSGDGRDDIIALTESAIHSLVNNGDGTFRTAGSYSLQQAPFQDTATKLDIDRDGKLDLAVKTPQGIQMLFGNGDGTVRFGPLSAVSGSAYGGIDAIWVANLNGDATTDLVASDGGAQRVFALRGNSDGSFTTTGSGITTLVPGAVVAADINRDGLDDAVAMNEFNPPGTSAALLLNNGQGGFGQATYHDGGYNLVGAAVGDFNRDGNPDVVSSDTTGSQAVVLAGNGSSVVTAGKFGVSSGPQTPVVADFNGDGKQDIGVTAQCSGNAMCLEVLLNNQ